MTKTLSMALTTASFIALAAPAFAQDATAAPASAPTEAVSEAQTTGSPDTAATEIVVTAQKRAQRLQDVPLSITVASQATLERQQVNTVGDLSRIAPSLEVQQSPGQNVGGGGQIRGIGTQSFQAGAVGSVGVVVDQVSQGNANISDLFDVARVEVLKGPQGTLFGLTTSAGVINIVTNAPDPTKFSARIRTELSNAGTAGSKYGDQIVQGVVNVPLAENAAIRVSGNTNLRQGVDRNALNDDHYTQHHTYGGRARLLWKPTDKLTINLIGDYTHVDENGDFFVITRASSPLTQSVLSACGITASSGNNRYCSAGGYYQRSRNYGGSAQVDYDAGPFTISSISSLRASHTAAVDDSIFRSMATRFRSTAMFRQGTADSSRRRCGSVRRRTAASNIRSAASSRTPPSSRGRTSSMSPCRPRPASSFRWHSTIAASPKQRTIHWRSSVRAPSI